MNRPVAGAARVLIVRLSAFGDVILTLPAVSALRRARPDLHLAWVVEDRAAAILEGHPDIDELIVMPRKSWKALRRDEGRTAAWRAMRGFGRELAARNFDLAIDFQGNLKSGLVLRSSRAARRIGLARGHTREPNWLLSNERFRPSSPHLHRIDRDLELIRSLQIDAIPRSVDLGLSEAEKGVAKALIDACPGSGPVLVLHPGTSDFFRQKRWPLERYAAIARALIEKRDARVILSWGPGERDQVQAVADDCPAPTLIPDRVLSARELAALLGEADLVLGSDTGPVHLGSVLGRPTVTLFGPYDPRPLHPHGHADRGRYAALPCSPCRYRDCPRALCMEELSTEEILQTARAALDGREAPDGPRQPHKTIKI